ncbi:hypothetical protein FYM13_13645 [Staphylococcus aureus]|uniref:hypothetical protein n=1 Tax=Staphylococcus aureus TaxID=1280 RepID=UPI0011E6971C|nr:hypothetical protein [Staphylococcus aureus]MCQ1429021.1 hypothetical protein [Staphylococcus aureus]TYN87450.1 hypothetical protein FYM10_13295 [Staphylococcus aureus]TYN90211.1 hypothetical protein FYM11_11575 [Staphylococcus aureus]TYN96473.1 hypothetical protein FYM19_11355 [Staphylococcus aureus]TYN97035.1 hypothetical protein FYM13_13645 [Staphylococcus aureus]
MDTQKMLKTFIEGYEKQTLNYEFLGDDIEKAFPLLKYRSFLNISVFNVPENIFFTETYVVIVDNFDKLPDEVTVTREDLNIYIREIMEHTEIERFNLFIRRKYNFLSKKNIFIVLPIALNFYNNLSTEGSSQADTDFKSWRKENQTPLNNYNHDKVSPYSHLDYEGLISNFDSPKYNSDFEYQMAQAEECYKRKLFLPAAATLSVALETLLMAICDKEKVKLNSKDSSDTMMNYLGQRLLSEGKINYRMHKRIDITYSLRNSVSHSNPGEVSKADCQIILSCIKVLIDEHYSK